MDPALKEQCWSLQLGLDHQNPYDFAIFSWQSKKCKVSGYYLIYRFVVAALFIAIIVFGLSISKHPNSWIIYFSHVGILLQTLHLIIAAAIPVQLLLNPSKDGVETQLSLLPRLSSFLYNVTNLMSLWISAIFWAGISVVEREPKDTDFLTHGLNSIMSICDVFVSKRPCRLLHFTHSWAIFVPYVVFTVIYWGAGGRRENGISAIYPILDWDNLSVTIPCVTVGLTLGLLFIHGFVWMLHLLRDRVIACVNSHKSEPQSALQGQWNPALVVDEVVVVDLKIQA